MSLPDFRTDIAQMASKDPPVAVPAYGDIASWFVEYAGRLRRAKQQVETHLRMARDSLPGNNMAAAEAIELNRVQYMASIALDVDQKESAEKTWKMLKNFQISDAKHFHDSMQQSECVCWQPLAR